MTALAVIDREATDQASAAGVAYLGSRRYWVQPDPEDEGCQFEPYEVIEMRFRVAPKSIRVLTLDAEAIDACALTSGSLLDMVRFELEQLFR